MDGIPMRFNGRAWPSGSVLAAIPENDRDEFVRSGTLREFQAGDVLVLEGDPSAHVYLLLDGFVKVTGRTEDGKTALLAIRTAGDLVGELAGVDDRPRSATVSAAGPTVAAYFTQQGFRAFLESHPKAFLAVTTSISAKLRSATRRRIDFAGRDVATRLARVLDELARNNGRPTTAGTAIDVMVTQSELAQMIGAAEISVNRRLAELRGLGAVVPGHGHITITDLTRLRNRAGLG